MNHYKKKKKDGGNKISKWHSVRTIQCLMFLRLIGLTTLLHIYQKNELNSTNIIVNLFGKALYITMVNNYFIRTWQSWLFKPNNLHYFRSMHLEMLLEYPLGIFIFIKHLKNASFITFVIVKKIWLYFPFSISHKSFLIFMA